MYSAFSPSSWLLPSPFHSHSTKKPEETKAVASEFMEYMRRKVENMCPDHVLNMDQTPIPFSFHSKRTWEKMGARTVHVLASTSETKRATLAATVTMGGELLPPLLIFKGSKNGRIEKMNFRHSHKWVSMRCKIRHGWMNQ